MDKCPKCKAPMGENQEYCVCGYKKGDNGVEIFKKILGIDLEEKK